ncbi:hypothetical protein MXB_3215 [Myxobolus squamalis]|nr:hypothetical protein MXB_3215 [Myxobolus squamalis]
MAKSANLDMFSMLEIEDEPTEYPIENYTAYYGCSGLHQLSTKTAFCIRKLLDQGALLLGTTTMPQIGSNAIGFNPSSVFPSPRNPWNANRYTGGSSSGNGVVVGMGLCPFAIGSDALGSIRVPSGFCGIVGLRSTFSRVSNKGATPLDQNAFLVIGPMACCVGDAAIVYAIISGPDEEFALGINQPYHFSPLFENYSLKDKKFGICMEYISNADDNSISCFKDVCDKLRLVGSQVLDIPIPELLVICFQSDTKETSAAAGAGTIRAIHESILSDQKNIILKQSYDTSLLLVAELGSRLSENHQINVKKQRTRSMNVLKKIFESVDYILLLNTCTPPPEILSSHTYGILDGAIHNEATFFASLSSLTGVPALCLNIGYQKETGLPISIQILSRWWSEDSLLSVGNAIENIFPLNRKPSLYECPLNTA